MGDPPARNLLAKLSVTIATRGGKALRRIVDHSRIVLVAEGAPKEQRDADSLEVAGANRVHHHVLLLPGLELIALDGEVLSPLHACERRDGSERDRAHAGQRLHSGTQPLVEIPEPLALVAVAARVDGGNQRVLPPEAGIEVAKARQAAEKQRRADQQQERQ